MWLVIIISRFWVNNGDFTTLSWILIWDDPFPLWKIPPFYQGILGTWIFAGCNDLMEHTNRLTSHSLGCDLTLNQNSGMETCHLHCTYETWPSQDRTAMPITDSQIGSIPTTHLSLWYLWCTLEKNWSLIWGWFGGGHTLEHHAVASNYHRAWPIST